MTALYNEFEPYAAKWLENLSTAGLITRGVVDARSIKDLTPAELVGRTQAHFFAGIGVWSHALRLAGWPDAVPVWTGSCPCQPFSAAGRKGGFDDERHLWPVWFELIRQCRPPVIFGEQVASPDGLKWFDAVSADLEGAGYAVGAADLCVAGFGAPHIRQRLFWVAVAGEQRREGLGVHVRGRGPQQGLLEAPGGGAVGGVAVADDARLEGHGRDGDHRHEPRRVDAVAAGPVGEGGGPVNGFWDGADWLYCRDGKYRPVEPGTFPLAHGAPSRVGRLRAYGNAISPYPAKAFIEAALEWIGTCS